MINEINVKQAGILLSIVMFANKFVILPSLTFYKAGFAGIFVTTFLLGLDLLIFYLIIKFKEKNQNKKIDEVLISNVGKFFTKVVYIILFVYFLMRIFLLLNENYSFLKDLVYEDATFLLFIVCLLPVVNAMTFTGIRTMGRTAQFFYWFIIVGLFISLIAGIFSSSFSLPTIKINREMLFAPLRLCFWFSDYLFFFMIIDKIKLEKNYGNTIMKYLIFTAILLVVLNLIFVGLHDINTFIYKGALADIIQFSSISPGIGKIDIVAVLTKMFVLYFQTGIMFYCLKESLNNIVGNLNIYQSIIVLDFIILFIQYFCFVTMEKMVKISVTYFNIITISFLAILLAIFLFAFFKQKRRDYEKIY